MTNCPYCGQEINGAADLGGLTPQQSALLQWLIKWDWSKQVSPSYDEIRNGIGLKSRSGVHRLIHGLAERGFVKFIANRSRSIVLVTTTKE